MYLSGLLAALGLSPSRFSTHGHSRIQWGPCDSFNVNDTSLSCGYFDVPLDYHDSSVGNARLALIKANATGERQGTVFFNPGGPGGSGVEFLDEGKDMTLRITGGVYDVVSWDPRGVGFTIPGETYCFDSLEDYMDLFNGTVELTGIEYTGNFTDPADIERLLSQAPLLQEKYEQMGKKCLESQNGKVLQYMGTAAAVRDVIAMADVLDGPGAPVNFVGFSGGSLIGSWLVNMYPERVGRVIVDGVLNSLTYATQELSTHWEQTYVSTDTIYQGIITGCALSGPGGCAIAAQGDTAADIDAKIQNAINATHDAFVKNSSTPIASGVIRNGLYRYVMYETDSWSDYINETWPLIVQTISEGSQQNMSLSGRAKYLPPRKGFMKRQTNDSPSFTNTAIFCGDSVDRDGSNVTDIFRSVIKGVQDGAHIAGGYWPSLASHCSIWPVRSVERYQGPFNKTPANKVLVASNMYDPITPLPGAQAVAAALGEHAALLRVNGFGHPTTVEQSTCKEEIYAMYMVNGTLPANNTLCEVDTDFEVFAGVTIPNILQKLNINNV